MTDPHVHFFIALIPVVFFIFIQYRQLPSVELTAVTFVGSQFPDIIDKPLGAQLNLIPTGRVFIHSLPFAVPICIVILAYSWRTDRARGGVVFVYAYLSHLAADNYSALAAGRIPNDLLWPFRPAIPRPSIPYWAGPNEVTLHLFILYSVVVLLLTTHYVIKDVRQQFWHNRQ